MEARDAWKLTDRLQAPTGKGDPFAAAVRATRMSMVITDPTQLDNPIVFVNDAFVQLTGYRRDEIIGRNCRFLQGPDTDPGSISAIRKAIETRTDIAIDILNYRRDGTPFWNALYLSPVTDDDGEVLFFFASQLDVTRRKRAELDVIEDRDRVEAAVADRTRELEAALQARTDLLHEVDHRVKNNLQLISALVLIERRKATDPSTKATLTTLRERVEALSAVHRLLYRDDNVVRFDIAGFIREFAAEATHAGGKPPVGLKLDLESLSVAAAFAAPVALMASELVRIAISHALTSGTERFISLSIKPTGAGLYRFCIADDGFATGIMSSVEPDQRAFIELLATQLHAKVHWDGQAEASHSICVDLPIDEPPRGG
ncbi:PAS domain S-box-containing protein [Kaistia soli DSM 19436]|uniref:PAS domain S-box-containing protein n=1 Tax=Kaistia soli DSM 19436 TaxID=1122133 RepID=A0A1M5FNA1_9HYPH|nr:PAS domain-containing protein [Kaistia soli]SHF92985.1 PAS domain S-box-containing protein [Kaistia soli DSM 19436]